MYVYTKFFTTVSENMFEIAGNIDMFTNYVMSFDFIVAMMLSHNSHFTSYKIDQSEFYVICIMPESTVK